jgi:hypothetical protein
MIKRFGRGFGKMKMVRSVCQPVTTLLPGSIVFKGGRGDEPGYCSYMALEGNQSLVSEALEFIENNADHIKDINYSEFEFTRVPS